MAALRRRSGARRTIRRSIRSPPANVQQLPIAWEWKPNEKALPQFGTRPGAFQNTPLVIDGVMYLSTPYNQVAALDPATGKELWRYDPKAYEDGQPPNGQGFAHRGVVAWKDARSAFASSSTRATS